MHKAFFIMATLLCFAAIILYSNLAYSFSTKASSLSIFPTRFAEKSTGFINTTWYPPNATWITDLADVVNGSGTHGFVFKGSRLPKGVAYGAYNWCNMPHIRREEYGASDEGFELIYVEVIHRHHKRTPYAANTFPKESYSWSCLDTELFQYGSPLNLPGQSPAPTYWNITASSTNPFAPAGFNGSCQFPQITHDGLEDSWQHGKDLFGVYHDLLRFLPDEPDGTVVFRVTNNPITSQVASMVISAMYPSTKNHPFALQVQPASIDSLEPVYPCPFATSLYANYSTGSNNTVWQAHLQASTALLKELDAVSNVSFSDVGFHQSFDHYFDNLSSRQCHAKPLPCSLKNNNLCISQEEANAVYRLGEYEYAYTYRSNPSSLIAATASYGVYIAELAQNIRDTLSEKSQVKYRHNVAHDGSVSRLLSILQVDIMVWPGMGAEVVFEVYKKNGIAFVRVLWSGKVLRSSSPILGVLNMVELDVLLNYFDGLVGMGAKEVVRLCSQ